MATKEFTWENSKDEFESKNLIGLDLETVSYTHLTLPTNREV